MSSINSNPLYTRDLLTNIFSFLEPEDILRIQTVSKLWKDVALSDALWNQLCNKEKTLMSSCLNIEDFKFKKTLEKDPHFIQFKERLVKKLETIDQNPSYNLFKELKFHRKKAESEVDNLKKKKLHIGNNFLKAVLVMGLGHYLHSNGHM